MKTFVYCGLDSKSLNEWPNVMIAYETFAQAADTHALKAIILAK
ncbi:hypothetical protein SAMN05414139_10424 [Burkholderia sp. D7]|nr:hypothetical protein SAMN05414139_10424 [Burkholderia sp. D7]